MLDRNKLQTTVRRLNIRNGHISQNISVQLLFSNTYILDSEIMAVYVSIFLIIRVRLKNTSIYFFHSDTK
jgi:hypothetical protein